MIGQDLNGQERIALRAGIHQPTGAASITADSLPSYLHGVASHVRSLLDDLRVRFSPLLCSLVGPLPRRQESQPREARSTPLPLRMLCCAGRHIGPVMRTVRDLMTSEHLKITHTQQARGAHLNRIPKALRELIEAPIER